MKVLYEQQDLCKEGSSLQEWGKGLGTAMLRFKLPVDSSGHGFNLIWLPAEHIQCQCTAGMCIARGCDNGKI